MTDRESPISPFGSIHISQLMNLELLFKDREGRFLAENKVPPQHRAGNPADLSECPYAGSRNRHIKPMNISALKQMINHWGAVKSHFNQLRSFCLNDRGHQGVTVQDFFEITVAGYMVPSFLFYRRDQPVANHELPGDLAALYKAALGMVTTAQVLLTKGLVTGAFPRDRILDGQTVLDFADRDGLFIGAEEVCAGPTHLILELLQLITAPSQHVDQHVDKRDADNGANGSGIAQLPDLPCFFRYLRGAEKVLLLDFCFPLMLYSVTPFGLISEFFQLLRAPELSAPQLFTGEISMELQLLDIVAPILDNMSVEDQQGVINGCWEIINDIDSSTALTDYLTTEDYDGREQYYQQLNDFLTRLPLGVAQQLGETERARTCELFSNYLLLERKKLKLYRDIQQQMNRELGHTEVCRAPDGLDITRMYSRKLRDLLAEFFSVKIENHWNQTIIEQGAERLVLE